MGSLPPDTPCVWCRCAGATYIPDRAEHPGPWCRVCLINSFNCVLLSFALRTGRPNIHAVVQHDKVLWIIARFLCPPQRSPHWTRQWAPTMTDRAPGPATAVTAMGTGKRTGSRSRLSRPQQLPARQRELLGRPWIWRQGPRCRPRWDVLARAPLMRTFRLRRNTSQTASGRQGRSPYRTQGRAPSTSAMETGKRTGSRSRLSRPQQLPARPKELLGRPWIWRQGPRRRFRRDVLARAPLMRTLPSRRTTWQTASAEG